MLMLRKTFLQYVVARLGASESGIKNFFLELRVDLKRLAYRINDSPLTPQGSFSAIAMESQDDV
ncbi:hypothetical protein PPGU16_78910 (plasmid) [Paraburkholderia largidicola]|uniref:Uncharacterized protein n=1 Tax=Paraburkholderia largidicola TaxID=3014751 RepID=A0A7I8C1E3_9BURK|nr:hypothetical protein PPGU16_78910 [Paraburkholderia sp. PGU16]